MTYPTAILLLLVLMPGCGRSQEAMVRKYADENANVRIVGNLEHIWALRLANSNQILSNLLPLLANCDEKLAEIKIAKIGIQSDQFQQILELPIKSLWIVGGSVTLQESTFKKMSQLQRLRINRSNLAGPLAQSLGKLNLLSELDLAGTDFVDGFQHTILGEQVLGNVESLNLSYSEITDEDLKHIAKQMPNLKQLDINATKVTGKGLLNLAPIHSLETVSAPGVPIEDILNARKAHLDAKREARKAGIRVPSEERSPFGEYLSFASEEQLAKSGLLPDKRVQKARGLLRDKIVNLVGSEKGMKIVWQVEEIIPEFAPKRNYIEDQRSLAEILVQDFGIEFEDSLRTRVGHSFKHPDNWGELPEKPLRYYLSGRLEEAIKHLDELK